MLKPTGRGEDGETRGGTSAGDSSQPAWAATGQGVEGGGGGIVGGEVDDELLVVGDGEFEGFVGEAQVTCLGIARWALLCGSGDGSGGTGGGR
ncbi:hypothetical protein AB0L63_31085 [Nocardia sp. NPDC051990]|uniref:hypothetical protein n=1 Tax=Nocardia sp. NPDC051990 TaxID=3155285 RepID=UPI00344568AF